MFNCQYILHIRNIRYPYNAMHVWTTPVLVFKPQPVVFGLQYTDVECIHKRQDSMIEEPNSKAWVFNHSLTPCSTIIMVSTFSSLANSGHCRSAALRVKKMVGRPRVSTIEIRRLLCFSQNCCVPRRVVPKCSTQLEKASLSCPTISLNSSTERRPL